MTKVTKIGHGCPPSFLHRLLGGDDFKVIDLGDKETAREIVRTLGYELSQGMDPDNSFQWTDYLIESLEIYGSIADIVGCVCC